MSTVLEDKPTTSGTATDDKTQASELEKVSFSVIPPNAPAKAPANAPGTSTDEGGSLTEVTFNGTDASDRARKYLVDLVHPEKSTGEDSATIVRTSNGGRRIINSENVEPSKRVQVRASDPEVKELIRDLPKWQEQHNPEQKVTVRERVELGKQGADPSLSNEARIAQQLAHIRKQLELGRSVRVDVSLVADAEATKGKLADLMRTFKDSKLLKVLAHGSAEEKEQIAQALGDKLHTRETVEKLKVERFQAAVRAEEEHNAPLNRLQRWGARALETMSSLWSPNKNNSAETSDSGAGTSTDKARPATSRQRISPEKQAEYSEKIDRFRAAIAKPWEGFADSVLQSDESTTIKEPARQKLTIHSVEALKATFAELANMRKEFGSHQLQITVSPRVATFIDSLPDDRKRKVSKALGL